MTDIYIAICCDRHIDEVVKVYTTPERAIEYAKDFVKKNAYYPDDIEEYLTEPMKHHGVIYYAKYSEEGDKVKVIKGVLDPKE